MRTVFAITDIKSLYYTNMPKEKKEAYIRSIVRAIKILEAFNNKSKMGITEISKMLNIPKSTTHNIVTTLSKESILEKDTEINKYFLGIKLFELGDRARENFELRKVSIPYLKELNETFDETVHLTVPENGEVLYIECFESTKRLRTYSVIGIRAPLHCTAVGKAILAYLPGNEIDRIIKEKGLQKFTKNTIRNKKQLLEEIKIIKKIGYAVDNMEHEEGVRCVGAPIKDNSGYPVASISISGPSQRITDKIIPQLAAHTIRVTNAISERTAYRKK